MNMTQENKLLLTQICVLTGMGKEGPDSLKVPVSAMRAVLDTGLAADKSKLGRFLVKHADTCLTASPKLEDLKERDGMINLALLLMGIGTALLADSGDNESVRLLELVRQLEM